MEKGETPPKIKLINRILPVPEPDGIPIKDMCKSFISDFYTGTWMFGGDRYYFPKRFWMDNGNEKPVGDFYSKTSKEARVLACIAEDPRDIIMKDLRQIATKEGIIDKFNKIAKETEDAASFVTRQKKVAKKINNILSKSQNRKEDYSSFLETRENFIKDAVALNCFNLIAQEFLKYNSDDYSYIKDRFFIWSCGYSAIGGKYGLCVSKSMV